MVLKLSAAVAGLVLLLAGGGLTGALAQDNAAQAGSPPPEQPAADQPPPEKPKCVTSNTFWKEQGKAASFEIELQNSCDVRLKCTVDAFIIGARGQAQGRGTVILAAAAKGQTSRGVYAVKVKSAGGMANISHSCKTL